MRAVDHHASRAAPWPRGCAQTSRDVLGVVVRPGPRAAAQDHVAGVVAGRSGRSPTTPCLVTDGNQCGDRAVSTASTAVWVLPSVLFLNPTGIDSPDASSRCTWLSVVRAPIATHDVRSAMCCGICVSRNSDAGRQPQIVDVEQQLPRQPQPLVDVEALVEVGIVDEPLPADRGARLLEVAAHHDDQLAGVAVGERLQPLRVLERRRRCRESSTGPTMTTSRGSRPSSTSAIAARASETTFEARSLIGISSSRIAGGMSGRTCVIRRSSVR